MIRNILHRLGQIRNVQHLSFLRSDVRKTHFSVTCYNIQREQQMINSISTSQTIKLPPRISERRKQSFDYFLVLDFEATCDAPENVVPQEIIEFPVLKVNGETFETESVFHSYIKPKVNPELTQFCKELTGIDQDTVDNGPYFEDVFMDFNIWMKQEGLFERDIKFTFVTCGDWDFKYLLQVQCKGLRIPIPPYMRTWINVKTCFAEVAQTWPRNLTTMLKSCELVHEGRLHSGLDDCKNIAKVVKDLADRGVIFEQNSRVY